MTYFTCAVKVIGSTCDGTYDVLDPPCDDDIYGIGPGAYCNMLNQCDCLPGYYIHSRTECSQSKIYQCLHPM